MSGLREIQGVQNPVTRYARSLGWYARRVSFLDRRGCPDTWFFRKREDGSLRLLICEWKRPDGGRLSVQQVRRIEELRSIGAEVHVISTADEGRALFNKVEEEFVDL